MKGVAHRLLAYPSRLWQAIRRAHKWTVDHPPAWIGGIVIALVIAIVVPLTVAGNSRTIEIRPEVAVANPPYCPPFNYGAVGKATLTIQLKAESVNSRKCWQNFLSGAPGEQIRLLLYYRNTSYSVQNQVVLRANLPPQVAIVPNTTTLYDVSHRHGILLPDNDVVMGGEDIGNFGIGANAYLIFNVALPIAGALKCGVTTFTPVGVAHPRNLNEYENSAQVVAVKGC